MSVQKSNGQFIPTCDSCGTELPPQSTFYGARKAMSDYGWHTRKEDGAWVNICDDCKRMEQIARKKS